jgi:hypothetical protein
MKLLERIASGDLQMHPRGLCNGGTAPDYDNVRWPGADGLRVPQEVAPATLMVKKEVDLGSISGSVTLNPTQSLVSFITATPTANSTIIWPACFPGLVVTVANLAAATYTLTCEISGNSTNTVVIPAGSTVQIVHDQLLDKPIGGLISAQGAGSIQTLTGTSDAVTFGGQLNVAVFSGTGVDAATLAVPGAGDVGKVLVLVSANGSANTVTTTTGKVVDGTSSTFTTATAPAHSGAVAIYVASSGFWNAGVFGTGTWVLS